MQPSPRIWGLLDDKAGHANQVRGLIEALAEPANLIELRYNKLASLPNALLGATMCHVRGDNRAELKSHIIENTPTLVIACGRRTEPVARAIKRVHPEAKIVYIMRPSCMDGWDCVIVPQHDNVMRYRELSRDPRVKPEDDKEKRPEDDKLCNRSCAAPVRPQDDKEKDARIIETLGPLHRITPALLERERANWAEQFCLLPNPRIGVLMGDVSPDCARQMIAHAQKLAGEQGSLLITNSRRTTRGLLQAMLCEVGCSHYAFDVHNPHTHNTGENPYLGILATADMLIVSGDSLSMCAEAAASGKPVYIDDSDKGLPKKHRAMHQALYEKGCAKPLSQALQQGIFSHEPSDEMEKIAIELRARFLS